MKIVKNIKFSLLALAAFAAVGCQDEVEIVSFSLSKSELLVGPERTTEIVEVSSAGELWIAETSASWITVSPANGRGNEECEFTINTTQESTMREATVRFVNSQTGDTQFVKVTQGGFAKEILVDNESVEVANYAALGERVVNIEITTNVDFDVVIEGENSSWVVVPSDFKVELERGYTPTKVNLELEWKINSLPEGRTAQINFVPKDSTEELETNQSVVVSQEAGELIEPTPTGDSLAVLAVTRSLNSIPWPTSERIMNWDGVELWEENDEGVTPENLGRVKSVLFYFASSDESLPFELSYLTAAETIMIRSNGNSHIKDLEMGDFWGSLPNLKHLEITAYGLTALDESLLELGSTLESLDLSVNNFKKVPTMISRENFPALTSFKIMACQPVYYTDLSNIVEEYGTLGIEQDISELRHFFEWDELECLALGVNYIHGELPTMEDHTQFYTQEIIEAADTLPNFLVGKPMVLPHTTELRINLNRLTGELPEWILYHPQLTLWDPDVLVFSQEGRTREGVAAGFSNVPESYDYYFDIFTHLDTY